MFQSCDDLILNLDLRGLNLTKVKTIFRNSRNLVLAAVILDNIYSDREILRMKFYKLKRLTIRGVHVDTMIQVNIHFTQMYILMAVIYYE